MVCGPSEIMAPIMAVVVPEHGGVVCGSRNLRSDHATMAVEAAVTPVDKTQVMKMTPTATRRKFAPTTAVPAALVAAAGQHRWGGRGAAAAAGAAVTALQGVVAVLLHPGGRLVGLCLRVLRGMVSACVKRSRRHMVLPSLLSVWRPMRSTPSRGTALSGAGMCKAWSWCRNSKSCWATPAGVWHRRVSGSFVASAMATSEPSTSKAATSLSAGTPRESLRCSCTRRF
mmetsp:Transcript_3758/g.7467  ORF Transcript_3758/g.7467 Transcript_3758/m.7467 type:complete len:228 (+) Transcript_3758:41-724(+)